MTAKEREKGTADCGDTFSPRSTRLRAEAPQADEDRIN
jgi:hypothetical protein